MLNEVTWVCRRSNSESLIPLMIKSGIMDSQTSGASMVPQDSDMRYDILKDTHSSPFFLHLGSTRMYKMIRAPYWWKSMKRDVAEYVAKCLLCHLVKVVHQRPAGPLQPVQIPQWKWDEIAMDFVKQSISRSTKHLNPKSLGVILYIHSAQFGSITFQY